MGDYHNHYLKKYVLLLADAFEKFIDICLNFYRLNPWTSGLSWDTMLKMTCVKLETISDIEKYLFIEKGLKGGISYIAKRHAKASNKYMNDYEPKKAVKILIVPNINNLYG